MHDEVRAAHEQFYRALNKTLNGDASSMAEIWARDETVSTTHPIGYWAQGWEEVKATWEEIAEVTSDGHIRLEGLQIILMGEVAYTIGVERGPCRLMGKMIQFDMKSTNIYRKIDGRWKIVHHHPDKVPEAENV